MAEIVLANRTQASAQRLAVLCQAQGIPRPGRQTGRRDRGAGNRRDLVICCTDAADEVLSVTQVTDARSQRRSPLVRDLGLPRNVDPAVGDLPGVTLLDLTTLARRLQQNTTRSSAISAAHHLVAQGLRSYLSHTAHRRNHSNGHRTAQAGRRSSRRGAAAAERPATQP